MSDSHPPPSMQIPIRSGGNFPYVVGSVVLVALIVALLVWKAKDSEAPASVAPVITTIAEQRPAPVHAPPPPPPVEEAEFLDAGVDPSASASGPAAAAGGQNPCAVKCGEGQSSPALDSALTSTAQSARGCYNRALRSAEVSGTMKVNVQVGSTGSVCNASISSDTVGSNEIASCVLGRFRGKTFPPPRSGCVIVTIPLTFTLKQ